MSEANYQIVRDALRGVATENHDVSNDFSSYDFTFAAKTGTAEVAGKQDFAWFACYAPYEDPRFASRSVSKKVARVVRWHRRWPRA